MKELGRSNGLRICDDYLQFQNHLKDWRKSDDLIVNTLNTTVLTATFRSQGFDASKQCQQLADEVTLFRRLAKAHQLDLDRLALEVSHGTDRVVSLAYESLDDPRWSGWEPSQGIDISASTTTKWAQRGRHRSHEYGESKTRRPW